MCAAPLTIRLSFSSLDVLPLTHADALRQALTALWPAIVELWQECAPGNATHSREELVGLEAAATLARALLRGLCAPGASHASRECARSVRSRLAPALCMLFPYSGSAEFVNVIVADAMLVSLERADDAWLPALREWVGMNLAQHPQHAAAIMCVLSVCSIALCISLLTLSLVRPSSIQVPGRRGRRPVPPPVQGGAQRGERRRAAGRGGPGDAR